MDLVLVSLLLVLNIFHTFLKCFLGIIKKLIETCFIDYHQLIYFDFSKIFFKITIKRRKSGNYKNFNINHFLHDLFKEFQKVGMYMSHSDVFFQFTHVFRSLIGVLVPAKTYSESCLRNI